MTAYDFWKRVGIMIICVNQSTRKLVVFKCDFKSIYWYKEMIWSAAFNIILFSCKLTSWIFVRSWSCFFPVLKVCCLSHEKDYRQTVVLFEFTILTLCVLYATDFETSKHLLDIHSSFHTNQEISISTLLMYPFCILLQNGSR